MEIDNFEQNVMLYQNKLFSMERERTFHSLKGVQLESQLDQTDYSESGVMLFNDTEQDKEKEKVMQHNKNALTFSYIIIIIRRMTTRKPFSSISSSSPSNHAISSSTRTMEGLSCIIISNTFPFLLRFLPIHFVTVLWHMLLLMQSE